MEIPTAPDSAEPAGVVERAIPWYHGMKQLYVRWKRRDNIHETFRTLATCNICHPHLDRFC
ncbi:hypothetical protein [Amycolatopsis sp. cmx-11-12]|uniref:hypothetical protein n=1 Tax=Amycolatopsis sp. cmx-11-12 TaxID=2785795 RepID=UPI0039182A72